MRGDGGDVGSGCDREDFGPAEGKLLGGRLPFAGGDRHASLAFASPLESLAGLHGGFQAANTLHASGAEDIFQTDLKGGIGT